MQRESHSFEICFAKKVLTGSIAHSISFNNGKSMIALFITTAIPSIVLIVMMYKGSLTALWTLGISF